MAQHNLIQVLVRNAKAGRKNNFIELSEFYVDRVYQIVFHIIPNEKIASDLTLDVFYSAWSQIKQLEEDTSFEQWIEYIAVIKAYYRIGELESEGKGNEVNINEDDFSDLENEFIRLPLKDRIGIILYDKMNFKLGDIANTLNLEKNEVADKILCDAKYGLAQKTASEKLKNISVDDFKKLIIAFKVDLDGGKAEVDPELLSPYLDFRSFSFNLKNIFSSIVTPEAILPRIKDLLIEESKEFLKLEEQKKKSKTTKKSEKAISESAKSRKLVLDVEVKKPKKLRQSPKFSKMLIPVLFVGAIIVGAYILFFSKSNAPWLIESEGNYTVNGQKQISKLYEGDNLVSTFGSEVVVTIEGLAKLKLLDESSVKIITTENENNKFSFEKGKLRIISSNAKDVTDLYSMPEYIEIQTSLANLKCGPGDFEIIKTDESLSIKCIVGWMVVENSGGKKYLGKGYRYITRINDSPLFPYHNSASEQFKREIDAVTDISLIDEQLQEIVLSAEEEDVLTLLQIIPYTNISGRTMIVNKLSEINPFYDFIGKEELVNMKDDSFAMALDFIKWELLGQ